MSKYKDDVIAIQKELSDRLSFALARVEKRFIDALLLDMSEKKKKRKKQNAENGDVKKCE